MNDDQMTGDIFEFTYGDYPASPGHRGVDTSIQAAADLAPKLGRLQDMMFKAIDEAGAYGATADEAADSLGLDRATCQPRTTELKIKGRIIDSGQRRPNRSGKLAKVWISKRHAPAEALAA